MTPRSCPQAPIVCGMSDLPSEERVEVQRDPSASFKHDDTSPLVDPVRSGTVPPSDPSFGCPAVSIGEVECDEDNGASLAMSSGHDPTAMPNLSHNFMPFPGETKRMELYDVRFGTAPHDRHGTLLITNYRLEIAGLAVPLASISSISGLPM